MPCPSPSTSPTLVFSLSSLALAVCTLVLAALCGEKFVQAGYIQYAAQGSSNWVTAFGYTSLEFVALVFHTLLFPLGLAASVHFGMHFYKSEATAGFKLAVLGSVEALLMCVICRSSFKARSILVCGVIFCSGDKLSGPLGKLGAEYCYDMIYLFVSLLFLVATTSMIAKLARGKFFSDKSSIMHSSLLFSSDFGSSTQIDSSMAVDTQRVHKFSNKTVTESKRLQFAAILACFIVFYPFCMFACTALPNSWLGFSKYYIRNFQNTNMSAYSPNYVGSVFNIQLSPHLILKLFGDVLAFYLFIYSMTIIALVAHVSSTVSKLLRCRPHFMFGFTPGECGMWLSFSALMLYEFVYWYEEHGWEGKPSSTYTTAEKAARTLGQLANVTMGLLVLPVSRNSVWSIVFGVSWEAMIRIHRWLGNLFLAIVSCHVFCWLKVFAEQDLNIKDVVHVPSVYHPDNFTIPLTIIMTILMFFFIGIFSFDFVRRKYFELFFYSHHFFMVVFMVVLWHAASAWYYIFAGLTLWGMDHFMRFIRVASMVKVHGLSAVTSEVTQLSFTTESGGRGPFGGRCTGMSHQMGQFAFINVPAVSHMEWHPFTLSSAPHENFSTFHIKRMGPGTFTDRLHNLATHLEAQLCVEDSSVNAEVFVNIDGPYGVPVDYVRYTHIIFVAGGIGVTPCMSYFKGLHLLSKQAPTLPCIRLLWACREESMLQIFWPTLASITSDPNVSKMSCAVHLTKSSIPSIPNPYPNPNPLLQPPFPSNLELKYGRPNLETEISSVATFGSSALVFVCGPNALKIDCERLTLKYGVDISTEIFEL